MAKRPFYVIGARWIVGSVLYVKANFGLLTPMKNISGVATHTYPSNFGESGSILEFRKQVKFNMAEFQAKSNLSHTVDGLNSNN